MKSSNSTKALAAAFTGNAIFGLSFLATKIALRHVSPVVLLSARFLISFLVLNLLVFLGVFQLHLKGKNLRPLLLLGLCQPVVYFICENYGIQLSSSSFSGIMIALVPVAAFILASIMLKEPFSMKKLLWVLCSVLGIFIISCVETNGGSVTPAGILFLSAAVISAALYNVLSRKSADSFSAFERTYMMFAVGFCMFTLLGLLQTRGRLFCILLGQAVNPEFILPVLFLSVFSSVLAFFCLNYAVSYLTVQRATSFTNMTTVISVAAGALLLDEPFTKVHVLGIIMILLGIYRVNFG